MIKSVGFAITGSFCTHEKILKEIQYLVDKGYDVLPIISETVACTSTRFGSHEKFVENLEKITGKKVIDSKVKAEVVGPNNLIDILVIAPCTGNTLSKLANSITDTSVTMVAKSHVRNNKPVVIGISTNDALGNNMCNLAKLISSKNYYFVPFRQDSPLKKPKSLISDFSLIEETMIEAERGNQLQPLMLGEVK